MDSGIIARRYAKALVAYCRETGSGQKAFEQARVILKSFATVPELRAALDNPVAIDENGKVALIAAAVGGQDELCDELRRFVQLVSKHHRLGFLPRIMVSFIDQWRESQGLKIGRLVTAVPMEGIEEKLLKFTEGSMEGKAEFITTIDPSIIGGFILEIDGHRIDASVSTQIGRVRRQFVEKNRRIV